MPQVVSPFLKGKISFENHDYHPIRLIISDWNFSSNNPEEISRHLLAVFHHHSYLKCLFQVLKGVSNNNKSEFRQNLGRITSYETSEPTFWEVE